MPNKQESGSGGEIKYTDKELIRAVERLKDLGGYNTHRAASQKAGQMLNDALNKLDNHLVREMVDEAGSRDGENVETGFDRGKDFSLG